MTTSSSICLEFGLDQRWEIENASKAQSFLEPNIAPAEDLASLVDEALSSPVEFPSLDQAVVPGDTVVFPVDSVIPDIENLVPKVLQWFVKRGCSPSNMAVVLAGNQPELASQLSFSIKENIGEEISVHIHDPDDSDEIAYVAANDDANPIYMNRTLVDADVVIPIICCRATSALDYFGAYGLYPLLSDRETRGAFYRLGKLSDPSAHKKLNHWADEAARWAGFMVEIQVIPAGKNRVAAIYSGLTEPLEKVCEQAMDSAWKTQIHLSELTIALLDGGQVQQNWLGIARALHAADRCTDDHGAIVICTQAKETIGKSLSRLRKNLDSAEDLTKKLNKDTSDDAIAASLVHQATTNKHVYLVSNMRSDTLESLGIGSVKEASQLAHLIDQFDSTTILGSAQHRHIVLS